MSAISITSTFDGGNIDVIDCSSSDNIRLSIAADSRASCRQWFSFKVAGAEQQRCRFFIVNAVETQMISMSPLALVSKYPVRREFEV